MSGNYLARTLLESMASYAEPAESDGTSSSRDVRLATVTSGYSGTGAALVVFDGETVAGARTYLPLTPVVADDRVVLLPVGGTYIIVGSVTGLAEASTGGAGITKYATDIQAKAKTATDAALTPSNLAALSSVSLFNGSTDGSGDVTLSQALTDFTYLTIFYKDNDLQHASIDVWVADCVIDPSSGLATHYGLYSDGGATTTYVKRRVVYFYSSTSLRNVSTQYVAMTGSTWITNTAQISITRVIGHY